MRGEVSVLQLQSMCVDVCACGGVEDVEEREGSCAAAAAVSAKQINKPFTCRLPDDSSIYTAELRAIFFSSQTC